MANLNYYLSVDHFKIGHYGDKHVKRINMALLVSGSIIVLTLIFYILMYSFTNFRTLDELEEISQDFSKQEEKQFSEINMAAKIMPSYNFKKNAIWMNKTHDVRYLLLIMYLFYT